jgi:dCTP deaminase
MQFYIFPFLDVFMLSGKQIKECIMKKEILIEPFEEKFLGPDSIDIRLGNQIMIAKNIADIVDSANPANFWETKEITERGFILNPNQFILGTIYEKIGIGKKLSCQIEGRSSVGRMGIMVHVTAGIIHAGWGITDPSRITLEMYSVNPNPVILRPGIKIAQLTFVRLDEEAEKGYDEMSGKYTGHDHPHPPKGL